MTALQDWPDKAAVLRASAYAFCHAFVAGENPTQILDKHFTVNARIFEHGPPWAQVRLPFLGRTFQGRRSVGANEGPYDQAFGTSKCDDYYELLTSVLSFRPGENTLPSEEDLMVDSVNGTVTVKLHATFASVQTGKSWQEDFVYILSEFDVDGKIGSQELWADPLSAWMAVQDGKAVDGASQ